LGEHVLWFLPKDSPQGYSVPLGYTSGDFRIGKGLLALSLNGNRGLWADDGGLWDSGECSRARFLDILYGRSLSKGDLLEFLRLADSPYQEQALPLPFLTAAALSCLSDEQYHRFLANQPHYAGGEEPESTVSAGESVLDETLL
jgi:hypothetical protein